MYTYIHHIFQLESHIQNNNTFFLRHSFTEPHEGKEAAGVHLTFHDQFAAVEQDQRGDELGGDKGCSRCMGIHEICGKVPCEIWGQSLESVLLMGKSMDEIFCAEI